MQENKSKWFVVSHIFFFVWRVSHMTSTLCLYTDEAGKLVQTYDADPRLVKNKREGSRESSPVISFFLLFANF